MLIYIVYCIYCIVFVYSCWFYLFYFHIIIDFGSFCIVLYCAFVTNFLFFTFVYFYCFFFTFALLSQHVRNQELN